MDPAAHRDRAAPLDRRRREWQRPRAEGLGARARQGRHSRRATSTRSSTPPRRPITSPPAAASTSSATSNVGTIPALDIRTQCSGFVYGLSLADCYIKSGIYRTVLVVGAEVQSTAMDVSDRGRNTAVIFADGAGAAVVRADARIRRLRDPRLGPPPRRRPRRAPLGRCARSRLSSAESSRAYRQQGLPLHGWEGSLQACGDPDAGISAGGPRRRPGRRPTTSPC